MASPAPVPAQAAPPRIAQPIPTVVGGQAPATGAGGNPMDMLRALLTSISPPPQAGMQTGLPSVAAIRG
jgi:hypothetical protein